MVSVSTSVPAMKATPSSTAKLVVRSRNLRAARVLSVVRNMALTLRSASCGRAPGRVSVNDISSTMRTVGEEDDALGVAGGARDRG